MFLGLLGFGGARAFRRLGFRLSRRCRAWRRGWAAAGFGRRAGLEALDLAGRFFVRGGIVSTGGRACGYSLREEAALGDAGRCCWRCPRRLPFAARISQCAPQRCQNSDRMGWRALAVAAAAAASDCADEPLWLDGARAPATRRSAARGSAATAPSRAPATGPAVSVMRRSRAPPPARRDCDGRCTAATPRRDGCCASRFNCASHDFDAGRLRAAGIK